MYVSSHSENKMTDEQKASCSSQPEARFQFGGVSASVFLNEAKRSDGSSFSVRRVVLQRIYMDAYDQYQATSSLDVNDLPKAVLALQRAYEHCVGTRPDAPEAAN